MGTSPKPKRPNSTESAGAMSDLVPLVEAARHRGLLVYPAASGTNAHSGDTIVVSPPLIISETEIRELVARLREASAGDGNSREEE
jgi:adenosylmethionine-8-amino-7-oxononanoate aminotransferase